LNAFRVVALPPAGDQLARAVRVALVGESPFPADADSLDGGGPDGFVAILDGSGVDISEWYEAVATRVRRSLAGAGGAAGRAVVYAEAGRDRAGDATRPLSLPVGPARRMRCELPVPDQWGHEYDLSVERVRRYDALLVSVLGAYGTVPEAAPTDATPA